MKKLLVLQLLLLSTIAVAQTRDFTRWVNPFIGTGGHGHTFPGATLPFGMVQLSPDTRIDNWDGSSGYHYSDDIIYGFSHAHLSGTGIPDGCDILFMPTIGEPQFFAKEGDKSVNGYASKFSHANEKAEPGYYSVNLDDDGILAEMTATTRVGFHRYTFPKTDKANIILDLKWRDALLDSDYNHTLGNRIEGFRRSMSWARNQTVYFVAEFSRPIKSVPKILTNTAVGTTYGVRKAYSKGALQFETDGKEPILIKVAISFVSIEGARKNLEAELPGWDFDKVRADAKAAWNKELSKIEVSGGTNDQTTIFYTALYHTMIHPNVFNDVDGSYRGHDGKTHVLSPAFRRPSSNETPSQNNRPPKGGTQNAAARNPQSAIRDPQSQYTVFSLWDTFRAAHPLYTIIDQKRTVDFINTFIRIYEQGGRLPVWELWGEETDTMIGYHAVSVIADAMSKGIEGFDYEKAYEAAKHSAELDHFGLAAYKKRGYISSEDDNESVSKTLEYAYNDWCLAEMERVLSGTDITTIPDMRFISRAAFFENLFDSETGFMRPKRNGGFIKPFAPNEVTFNFTEGNSWQYTFFVPHDVERLMFIMGGREKFAAKLDELFTTKQKLTGREQPDITGLIGQYAHGNEPSHHIPYLYNYARQPWKTQRYVRKIVNEFYKNAPDGLIGNEDCGQMSAWFVMSSVGFYPVAPGAPGYDLAAPIFKEVKFNLENGKTFTVLARNVSQRNLYVRSAKINGRRLNRPTLFHSDILAGGVMEFDMSSKPERTAFLYPLEGGFSLEKGANRISVAVPSIDGERVFKDQTVVTMRSPTPGAAITYTLDNYDEQQSKATQSYSGPFTVKKTSRIEAYVTDQGRNSPIVEAYFRKRSNDWAVKSTSGYGTQYTGGGDDAVVDGLRGNTNFASGEWQGYQGKTFEAVIDLQRATEINTVGGSFLQAARSWIWMPDRLEFEVSNDGVTFTRVADIKPGFPQQEMNPVVKEFLQSITPTNARYIRVRAYNIGKIPPWHPGAGGDPWIFVDEILIR